MAVDLSQVLAELQARVAKSRGDVVRHQRLIDELNESIREAEITLKTLRSLGVSATNNPPAIATVVAQPQPLREMKVTDMILAVLSEEGVPVGGARPKFVNERIIARFGFAPAADLVRTTLWRMAKDGRILSDNGNYSILSSPKGEEENPGGDTPGLFHKTN